MVGISIDETYFTCLPFRSCDNYDLSKFEVNRKYLFIYSILFHKEILTLVAKNAASSEPVSFYTANRCYRLVPVLAEFDIRLEVWINSYLRKYIIDNWQEKILVVNEKELKFQDL